MNAASPAPAVPVVLVIDDDEHFQTLARWLLATDGIRIATVASATEGLRLRGASRPHLGMLDVVLPDVLGWDVLRCIWAAHVLPVMPLTGRGLGCRHGAWPGPQRRRVVDQAVQLFGVRGAHAGWICGALTSP